MTPHQYDLLISRLLVLFIAFPLHELAHAMVADYLGDDTPRLAGRISLNPFKQLNVVGSTMLIIFGLGWAYVPLNPQKLRPSPLLGQLRVAIAGPLVNLILALAMGLIGLLGWVEREVAIQFCYLNGIIFWLNLLPLPPFDGYFIWRVLMPTSLSRLLARLEPLQGGWMLVVIPVYLIWGVDVFGLLIFNPTMAAVRLWFLTYG